MGQAEGDPKYRQKSKPKSSPTEQKYHRENKKSGSKTKQAGVRKKTGNRKTECHTDNRHRRLEPGVGRKVQVQNRIRRISNQKLKHWGNKTDTEG